MARVSRTHGQCLYHLAAISQHIRQVNENLLWAVLLRFHKNPDIAKTASLQILHWQSEGKGVQTSQRYNQLKSDYSRSGLVGTIGARGFSYALNWENFKEYLRVDDRMMGEFLALRELKPGVKLPAGKILYDPSTELTLDSFL